MTDECVDVITVYWNAPEWLGSSLESILGSEGVDVRCIVVDNASAQRPGDLAHGAELVQLEQNLGYAGGANEGLRHAMKQSASEYLAVAAHDAIVEPTTIARLVSIMEADPSVGIAGPVLIRPSVAGGTWSGRRGRFISSTKVESDQPIDRDWLSGTFLLGRRTVWEQLGGFDHRFGSYVEDIDVCLRARDSGWRVVVVPAASASGLGSKSTSVTRLVDINSALLATKRGGYRAFAASLALYAYWVLRGLVACLHPTRDTPRRLASLQHARDHFVAIGLLVISPGRAVDFRRAGRSFPGPG